MSDPTPLRPDDQVAGGFIAMRLGGNEYQVPVLPIRHNREWTQRYSVILTSIVDGVGQPKTLQDVAEAVNSYSTTFMDVLIDYDRTNVLPDREWIDTHATDGEVYTAMQQVTNAAFPLGSNLLELALMQAAQKVRSSLRSTSGSRPPTAGSSRRRKASKAA